jgi:predicted transglutaminase-like cysteine proteinase
MLSLVYRAICATLLLATLPSAGDARPVAALSLAPGAFASVALPVGHSRFDARWRRVFTSHLAANAISDRAGHLRGMERLQSVNTSANQAIAYREDRANGKANDYWSNASQTMARRSGDCEDYAIVKMQLLRNAGVGPTDMFMVIGNDNSLGSVHAMLLVREAGRMWVLDSLSDRILPSEDYGEFRPMLSFGSTGTWVYGYLRGTAPGDVHARPAPTLRLAYNNLASVLAAQSRP